MIKTKKFLRAYFVLLMEKMSVEDLTKKADVIVIGDVKEVESRWNLWRTMIYTYSTLSVEKYIKGTGQVYY